jgi:hypothetical protein
VLRAALNHNYQGKRKFQHGVFEQDLKTEAIHVEKAADASRIVQLAKRQLIPRNVTVSSGDDKVTSSIVSFTTDRHPAVTITTTFTEPSPTNTTGKSTGTPEPPPSDTTSSSTVTQVPTPTTPSTTAASKPNPTTDSDSKSTATGETTPLPTTSAPNPTTIRSTSFYTTRRTTFITGKNGQTSTSVEVEVVTPTATYVPSYPTSSGTSTKSTGDATLQNAASSHSVEFHLIVITIVAAGLVGMLL